MLPSLWLLEILEEEVENDAFSCTMSNVTHVKVVLVALQRVFGQWETMNWKNIARKNRKLQYGGKAPYFPGLLLAEWDFRVVYLFIALVQAMMFFAVHETSGGIYMANFDVGCGQEPHNNDTYDGVLLKV